MRALEEKWALIFTFQSAPGREVGRCQHRLLYLAHLDKVVSIRARP